MLRTVVASAAVASAAAFAAPAALPTRTQVRVAMPCPSWFGFAAVITFLWTLPPSAVFRSASPESLSAAGAAAVAQRQIHAREPQLVAARCDALMCGQQSQCGSGAGHGTFKPICVGAMGKRDL